MCTRRIAIASLMLMVPALPLVSHAWTPTSGIYGGASFISQRTSSPPSSLAAATRHPPPNDLDDATTLTVGLDSRRSFLTAATATAMSTLLSTTTATLSPAAAYSDNDELIDIYFGCGCFWHVQHEFVQAEKNILLRSDMELTARAGYAGGKAGSMNGKVCYHNAQNIADYGKLGHAEVVVLRIPTSKFEDFVKEYCKLFDKDGLRPDQFGDRGTEYRNLVGIPGGKSSPLADILVKASMASGDKLDFAVGKGDDADVPKVSFIMDTATSPFYVAENYHQFHDGFRLDENYPDSYNSLAKKFAEKGENFGSCPNGMMGLGIGGL
ncbi:hypothetical protein ACHAXH_002505 [Discostella pseudostelligera]